MTDHYRALPDRLLPSDPSTRSVARELYDEVAAMPIVSPHGHVPVGWLAENRRFSDPIDLLIRGDHYVTRLLHASGVDLSVFSADSSPRDAWRVFAAHWHVFEGTAVRHWLEHELYEVVGVTRGLSPRTADEVYDQIQAALDQDDLLPRAVLEGSRVDFLATTDDPLDDLTPHARIADSDLRTRVVPTFRPDAYLDPMHPEWRARVDALLGATEQETSLEGFLRSLRQRREFFKRHGAVSSDHGVRVPRALNMSEVEARSLFDRAHRGAATTDEQDALAAHLLWQSALMSVEDGLVMTLHPGVFRNHHTETFLRFGPDSGHDLPVPISFVEGLRPLLESFGTAAGFHLVLFTVDETTYSREIAPLAGFYPAVYIGAPWWYLDAPDAISRFRQAVTETAGFTRGSGFIDDTRALLSIPARHDTARRVDSGFLARLVVEGRLSIEAAHRIAIDLVADLPRRVFKL